MWELCLKNPRRKRVEPHTIWFVGRANHFMTRCAQVEKYTNLGNPVVSIQIGDTLVPNVLIELGVDINFMTRNTMEQLQLTQIYPTPIMLELVDKYKIKLKSVLDDVIVSIDSWE